MKSESLTRLFDPRQVFNESVTIWIAVILIVVLTAVPFIIRYLVKLGKISETLRGEVMTRYYSWLVIIPVLIVPILAGAFWAIIGTGLLSLFCYREYARATGLIREKWVSFLDVLGIVLIFLATLDHWHGLFMALPSLTVAAITAGAILQDRPQGYIQRVALGLFGYLLFGVCLGHLAYLANDTFYRPLIILTLLAVSLNDVFAFCCGKALGTRKLCPTTSPNKTVEGGLGALILTTLLVMAIGHFIFLGTAMDTVFRLFGLGFWISIAGQFGDLTLSSIKRDLGIKDMDVTIPGHGGLLDRFDSILLAAPIVFHYINYFVGVGLDQPQHVFSRLFLTVNP